VSSDSETPLFPQLEVWIRHCDTALSQAQADKNFRGILQAIKEQRAYLELKYKLQTEERRQRGLHKDRAQQGSGANDGLPRPPEDIYASIHAITLRLRIRAHRRLLGEQAVISEPTNLEYLRGQAEVLRARLEQRELLEQSVGLARIWRSMTETHRPSDLWLNEFWCQSGYGITERIGDYQLGI
jgi:hypothetical protein